MSTPKTALIIGASRGLGLGLVKQLLQDGWDVTATVRDPGKADALKAVGPVQIEKLDMDDQQAVIALSQRLKDRTFDLLFVNAGTAAYNMVYRRHDGTIGWVEPRIQAS